MNKKKIIIFVLLVVILTAALLAASFYWKNLRGIGPAIKPSIKNIADDIKKSSSQNAINFPLKLPPGFKIEVFAENLPGVRVMKFDLFGNMWVSQTSEGIVTLLEIRDGKMISQSPIFKNLKKPHGLAFHPELQTLLYIAEENGISRASVYSEGGMEKIIDLPAGGRHFTRTIDFGPDGKLYIAIGSSCDVCNEKDIRRAKIFKANDDGTEFKEFARGLRNTVFFVFNPWTREMWGTDMGRDMLGDNLPPDEINIIKEDMNYGWPTCYGKNIHDTDFDKNTYIRNPCTEPFEVGSHIDLQAHSAPLGLDFVLPATSSIRPSNWPEDYWYNLVVAYHGSWNRTDPTGYKLVRIKLDKDGNYLGVEDFISGWITNDGALGRPADVKFGPDGALYVSDDKAGLIYRIEYNN